jgi:signal transduction histidine kinase
VRFRDGFSDTELSRLIETVAFRIIEEALENVYRYAGVQEVEVAIGAEEDRLVIRIDDQGTGFDPGKAVHEAGIGLKAMRERAELSGGSLSVDSAPGRGTHLTVVLPLD